MALRKVTGLWFRTAKNGERYLPISLGCMGRHVLIQRRNEWEFCYLAEDGPVLIGKVALRKSDAGQHYMVLPLGDAGKFILFENAKLNDSSPDWTMNREVADTKANSDTTGEPVAANDQGIPY